MNDPHIYKFDLRLRSRLLRANVLSEAEIAQHLETLPDLSASVDYLDLAQPALAAAKPEPEPPPAIAAVPAIISPIRAVPARSDWNPVRSIESRDAGLSVVRGADPRSADDDEPAVPAATDAAGEDDEETTAADESETPGLAMRDEVEDDFEQAGSVVDDEDRLRGEHAGAEDLGEDA